MTVNLSEARIIIFAGAGASSALGKPTTVEFIKQLEKDGGSFPALLNLYTRYCKEETKFQEIHLDSEWVRDWLLTMKVFARDIDALIKTPPFQLPNRSSNTLLTINEILNKFDELIRNVYGEVEPIRAYEHYRRLFEPLFASGIKILPFYTTNYDLVIESLMACNLCNWRIETGLDNKGIRQIIDLGRFKALQNNQDTIILLKLHGSTNWSMDTNSKGQIEWVKHGNMPSAYKDVLIYPTTKKFDQLKQLPFSFFYDLLKDSLTSSHLRLCIVIGYSFRDIEINKLFAPAFDNKVHFLIVDTNPSQLESHMKKTFPSFDATQIKIENFKFGTWQEGDRLRFMKILDRELSLIRSININL